MKLFRALEIADECGLETVDEAIRNIRMHSPSLFVLEKIDDEIDEMMLDWYKVLRLSSGKFGRDSSVKDVMRWIDGKDI